MGETRQIERTEPNEHGYRSFELGSFRFARDEYFAYIDWPQFGHIMSIELFLQALQRDLAYDFFYSIVSFDRVFGTINHYGSVELFGGKFEPAFRDNGRSHTETFDTEEVRAVFVAMLEDWTNEGFDPFVAPLETGSPFGPKRGSAPGIAQRGPIQTRRMVGLEGDSPLRTDDNGFPVNRAFADIDQSEPEVHAEPGFESEVAAFNLYAYLSRCKVTWNPSVVSRCGDSLWCPTTEEHLHPLIHGNDRPEWLIQLSGEVIWDVEDRDAGFPRARLVMRAGDVAALPADVRHRGYSPSRSMLLVWENASVEFAEAIERGEVSVRPVEF